jgi:hypothetical protein
LIFTGGPFCRPRDADHGDNEPARYLCDTAGGNVPAPETKGNAMTDLNNEVRELNIDELDAVSGGWSLRATLAQINMELYIQHLKTDKPIGKTLI